jgi:hypothetical protein
VARSGPARSGRRESSEPPAPPEHRSDLAVEKMALPSPRGAPLSSPPPAWRRSPTSPAPGRQCATSGSGVVPRAPSLLAPSGGVGGGDGPDPQRRGLVRRPRCADGPPLVRRRDRCQPYPRQAPRLPLLRPAPLQSSRPSGARPQMASLPPSAPFLYEKLENSAGATWVGSIPSRASSRRWNRQPGCSRAPGSRELGNSPSARSEPSPRGSLRRSGATAHDHWRGLSPRPQAASIDEGRDLLPGSPAAAFARLGLHGQTWTLDALCAMSESVMLIFSDLHRTPCTTLMPPLAVGSEKMPSS